MPIDDPDLRSDVLKTLTFLESRQREHPWQPPTGPFVVSAEHRRLIAQLEALPQNRDGSVKEGGERELHHWLDDFKRARLVPLRCNPS
jgi:hypothetical protein